jgi:lipoprotein-anchoring transpeptidase ErfK/SrfK
MSTVYGSGIQQLKIPLYVLALVFSFPAVAQNSIPAVDRHSQRFLLVSIPDRKLVVIENENAIATFDIALGAAESPSPTGEFQFVNRVVNPTYYHPGTVILSGKNNPIGTRWLGLSQKGYGIHGTNVPKSVGQAASHGCIRLRNRDVERLFSMVRIGDRVEIHAARDEQIARFVGTGDQKQIAETDIPSTAAGGQ